MIRTALAAAGAAFALAGAASAADNSVTIDTSLADFSDPAETQVVYDRVVDAAERVCRRMYRNSARSALYRTPSSELVEACVSVTVDTALADADIAALSALHSSMTTEEFEVALQ